MKATNLRAFTARSASIATALALAALPGITSGAAISWVPDADGFWDVAANWSSNPLLPTGVDDVTIDVGGAVVRVITHRTGTTTIRAITNAETINVTNASTLTIQPGGLPSTNSGTLLADNGTINLGNTTLNNAGGTLSAINSGRINLGGTLVIGGTLSTATSGAILTGVGTTATLNGVTLASGAQFIGSNASTTTLIGTINNAGLITLSSGGNTTDLNLSGAVTLTGAGGVLMGNNINNRIVGSAGSRLINDVGHTIQGGGQIGANAIAITNAGLIVASQPASLDINPNATGMFNSGTLRATSGATLNLSGSGGGSFTNTGGTIEAQAGSTVRLTDGAVIIGGTLLSSGSGLITTPSGGGVQNSATLNGVTVSGGSQFVGAPNSVTTLIGTITNNGTMALASTGLLADFYVSGDVTLTGSGLVSLSDNAANRIVGGAGGRLSNDVGHTIAGSGQIGAHQIALTNAGLIVANQPTALVIDPNATGMINGGTLRAAGGATLTLTGNAGGAFDNATGTIEAQAGSTVRLTSNAIINGGTLTTSDTGIITTPSGGAVQDSATLNGVTISSGSQFVGADNSQTTLLNTITNSGTMMLASTGNGADLYISGDVTLTGGGTVLMGNHINNRIRGGAGGRLINDATHTIAGSGQIGAQLIAITNAGLIVANQPTELVIDPNATGMINTGTLRATNNATLYLTGNGGGGFANTGGTIEAQTGSTVRLTTGAIIAGGTLLTSGSGIITTPSGGAVQDSATLDGVTIASGSQFVGADNSQTTLLNTITNSGTMTLASTGNGADLFISGDVTLTGGGSVLMGNHINNRIRGGATGRLINDATHTIAGSGQIGAQLIAITNAGLIVANQATELVIDPNATGMINTGTLRATNNATLFLTGNGGGGFANTGGTIEAQAGSFVRLVNGAVITGGTLTTSDSGLIVTSSGGAAQNAATLDGVTVSSGSHFVGADNSVTTLRNTITNNGLMTLASTGLATDFYVSGDVTLSGSGVLAMNDSAGNRIYGGAGSSLTNAAGHVIAGGGQIGLGVIGLNNQGVIAANQPVGLTINPSSAIVNSGTLQANAGSALTLVRTVNNSGTILANGGTVNANAGFTGAGTARIEGAGSIVMGAAGTVGNLVLNGTGTLALGANNITVSTAYSNANFGTGNSYNPRANVSGTGQIRAAGDVAQAITGASVTNGTTGTATLTIGNVHLGANTVSYQIANTGTTGPALSGALQTSINGGNITDARLSGTGVTASNWGPVGTGGATGSRNVTFTAASAGALAPLVGQVVHIANNFDNVPDQNLNIVLAGGAAAYNLAQAFIVPSPASLPNQRVGGTVTQALTVSNNAPAGSFTEGLNASFGANTGDALNNGGAVNLLAGGASNSTNMVVRVDTSTPGFKSGSVTVNTASDGTGTSGLGITPLSPWNIFVNGNVYQAATGAATPTPVVLGNQRVGGSVSQVLTVANTAAAGSFSEDLNASFGASTGNATGSGTISGRLAGTNNTGSGSLSVGVDTSAAGARSGTVTVNYQTAGAVNGVSNGLGTAGAGNQVIAVSGNVYQVAAGAIVTAPLNFGTVQVGQAVSQNLVIGNIASGAAGFVEDLNASFGAAGDGRISGVGSLSGILAGTNSTAANGVMTVSVNTAAPGVIASSIGVNFTSAGAVNGVSNGLGTLGVGAENYGVSGSILATVIDQAKPVINGVANPGAVSVNLGSVRIGTAANQNLTVLNQATGNPQAALNGSIATNGAPVLASGNFNLLAPGATSGALSVGVDTSAAGVRAGSATVSLVSDASNVGGCEPNCQLNLPNQIVNVSADVYRLANPVLNTGTVTIAARVGDAVAANQGVSITNASPDIYTEGLRVNVTGTSGNAQSNGGAIANLAAQGTDSASIRVGLNSTAVAGVTSGSVSLGFVSTGAGTTGASDLAVGTGLVTVSGKVYTPAVTQIGNTSVNFGIVHVGDSVSPVALQIANVAPVTALNDTLHASFGAVSGPFSGTGSIAGLAAGGASTGMTVALDTSTAGVFNGSGEVNFASHNPDMTDLTLGQASLIFAAQINNYANPEFVKTGGTGTLSGSGGTFALDLGDFFVGSGVASASLAVLNDVLGPADLVDGSFNLAGVDDFGLSGFNSFTQLNAGQLFSGLLASFAATSVGSFDDTVLLLARGYNASGFEEQFNVTLLLHADVLQQGAVPEPTTIALLGAALVLLACMMRRRNLRSR